MGVQLSSWKVMGTWTQAANGLFAALGRHEAPAADGVLGGLVEAGEAAAELDLDFFGQAGGADEDAQQHLALLAEAARGMRIDRLRVVQVVGVEARGGNRHRSRRGSDINRRRLGWRGRLRRHDEGGAASLTVFEASSGICGGGWSFFGFGGSGGLGLGSSGRISTSLHGHRLDRILQLLGGHRHHHQRDQQRVRDRRAGEGREGPLGATGGGQARQQKSH
jgi:hypothetical protein